MLQPRVTIVTPNFNGAAQLEECIDSVVSQGYGNLQYIVMDGGSTDGSVDIIRRRRSQIDHWVSEPDSGPAEAIKKGFARADGEWLGWLNSDDRLMPRALESLAQVVFAAPTACWVTGCRVVLSPDGAPIRHGGKWYENGLNHLVRDAQGLAQEATFFRKDFYDEIGGINEKCRSIFDRELFLRMFERAPPVFTPAVLGAFRRRPGQLSHDEGARSGDYVHLERVYGRRRFGIRLMHRVAKTRLNGLLNGTVNMMLRKAWFSDVFGLRVVAFDDLDLKWKNRPYHELDR